VYTRRLDCRPHEPSVCHHEHPLSPAYQVRSCGPHDNSGSRLWRALETQRSSMRRVSAIQTFRSNFFVPCRVALRTWAPSVTPAGMRGLRRDGGKDESLTHCFRNPRSQLHIRRGRHSCATAGAARQAMFRHQMLAPFVSESWRRMTRRSLASMWAPRAGVSDLSAA